MLLFLWIMVLVCGYIAVIALAYEDNIPTGTVISVLAITTAFWLAITAAAVAGMTR